MELHDIPSLLWSCHPRIDRPRRDRPTDRPADGRRRVDRDRRLNDAAAAAAGAGGVVERTEKLLAAREGASCREGGGPSALQNFNFNSGTHHFVR